MKQIQVARRQGVEELESYFCEALCLIHLGRESEVGKVLASTPDKHSSQPWCVRMYAWFRNQVSDEALLQSAKTKEEQIDVYFWVGDRMRARGDIEEGDRLILRCLDLGLPHHHEHQHAMAMKLSGQLQVTSRTGGRSAIA
jgi:hypothetical protein